MLSLALVTTFFCLIMLSCLILGRLVLKILKIDQCLTSQTVVNIPIYGAAGFVVTTLILNVIGMFTIGIFSLIVFLVVIAFAAFILLRLGDLSLIVRKINQFKNLNWPSYSSAAINLILLILIILTFYHFSQVIDIMFWPRPGDILSLHGPLTSLLLFNGKITTTLEPLSSSQLYYPVGFHTVAANFASWFHLFPGEAVFLLGGFVVILIPLILCSLTYMITKSIPLSLLVYFAFFIIHPSGHMGRWMLGYFYNGPYPSLTAFMIIIFSICILSLEYVRNEKQQVKHHYMGSMATLFLSFLGLLLVYPPFIVWPALMIIFLLIKYFDEIVILIRKKLVPTLSPFIIEGLVLLFLPRAYVYTPSRITEATRVTTAYVISPTFLFDHITGYVMWIALFIAVLFLLRKRYSLVNLFYISVFLAPISTLSPLAPSFLFFVYPTRIIMIPWITSWFILSLGVSEALRIKSVKKIFHSSFNISIFMVFVIIIIILLPQFTTGILQEFCYVNAQKRIYYAKIDVQNNLYRLRSGFPDDYIALYWILYHIPREDLILTDLSWTSFWILSYSVKNVTYSRIMSGAELERAKDLLTIWQRPYENNTIYNLLKKYNIKYIFVTSERGYYDDWKLGGSGRYRAKPFTPRKYISIFDSYSYLKIAFRSGFTTVYKVDL